MTRGSTRHSRTSSLLERELASEIQKALEIRRLACAALGANFEIVREWLAAMVGSDIAAWRDAGLALNKALMTYGLALIQPEQKKEEFLSAERKIQERAAEDVFLSRVNERVLQLRKGGADSSATEFRSECAESVQFCERAAAQLKRNPGVSLQLKGDLVSGRVPRYSDVIALHDLRRELINDLNLRGELHKVPGGSILD